MLTSWVKETLSTLDEQSMRRSLRSSDAFQINWGSNNYLALASHPQVVAAAQKALAEFGAGATSSRLIAGHTSVHETFEADLAAFFEREAALVFPSGYMANLGVIPALAGPGDALILDRLCHASLIDAARLSGARLFVYPHADPIGAEKALARASSYRRRVLVTESLFSMDGDFAPLDTLLHLANRYGAMTVVDEAHAIGVWPSSPALKSATVVIGTLSKALGSQGGFAVASRDVIDLLVNKSRSFIFTTGLAPACVAAAQKSLNLIKEGTVDAALLQRLSESLRTALQTGGWNIGRSQSQIIPILLGDASRSVALSERFRAAGHRVPAIRPPTVPDGECRVRLSVTAEHTEADISKLLEVLHAHE